MEQAGGLAAAGAEQPLAVQTSGGSISGKTAVVYPKATVQDFLERYEVGETVGVGGFAVVKCGRDKITGEPVAIKVVDKSRYAAGDNSLEREIQVLCKVDHPNCIKLYAVYITGRKVYIVTELVTGGELLDRVTEKGNYTELDAAHIIRQILQGVQYLHSHGIVHRDLKLENMVMLNAADDSPVKIADFGLSKFFSADNVLSTMCGSPQYVAPEVLGVGDGLKEYSPAVDMWSVGVILFILLSGYSPFDDDNDAVLFEKIKSGNYDADDPIWENISDDAKDAVAKLLTVDAEARLTAEEALNHPWVQGRAFEVETRRGKQQQLQSAMDKMKTMAVKRESMRQQSFKAAAGDLGGLGAPGGAGTGGGGGAAAAAAAAGGAKAAAAGGGGALVEGEHEGQEDADNAATDQQQQQQQRLLLQQVQQQQQMELQLQQELLRQLQHEQHLLRLQQEQLLLRQQQQQQLAEAHGLPAQQIPAAAMLAALQPSLVQGLPPPAALSPPPPATANSAAAAADAPAAAAGLGSTPAALRAGTPQQQPRPQPQPGTPPAAAAEPPASEQTAACAPQLAAGSGGGAQQQQLQQQQSK